MVDYNTPEMRKMAEEMLAEQQDYSPAACKNLPFNRMLCSYGNEAWVVDTHDDILMHLFTKIQRII